MTEQLRIVKAGLALVLIGLVFGIGLGISFGINEEAFIDFIAEEVATHPDVHDEKTNSS